jgi:hypothetical protein
MQKGEILRLTLHIPSPYDPRGSCDRQSIKRVAAKKIGLQSKKGGEEKLIEEGWMDEVTG